MSIIHYIDLFFQKTLVPLNYLRMKNNPAEAALIDELKERVRKLPIPNNANFIHNQWLRNILEFKKCILSKDPKNFFQWSIVRKTMFIGNALFTLREWFYLRQNNWNKWKKAITEKNYVYTEPFILYPKSSGNLIHYAYHLAKFEDISGKKIKDFDFIFEYGGGYGGICQLVYNLGFKGKYIIFDLPILSALQTFYLKMNGIEKSVLCLDDINKIKKMVPKKGRKLFIATWSLSESPLEIRKKVYPIIQQMDAHLIGYQDYFGEIDNHKYFKDYQEKLDKFKWWNEEIAQLRRNFYLFGFK